MGAVRPRQGQDRGVKETELSQVEGAVAPTGTAPGRGFASTAGRRPSSPLMGATAPGSRAASTPGSAGRPG